MASLSIPGALHAEGLPAEKAGFESRLTIYLAKGAPDACGPGCDRWIAIEGEVDQDAGPRIRRFLAGVKDMQRPIYLHSPGGNVEQSYVIGRLLRSRKAVARVGRTIATACAAGTQLDAACLKIKNAGGEVEAELTTRNAMCNSACGYLFLGATSREVAPDAAMAVHNSRLMLVIHGHPPAKLVADARQRQIETSNRARTAFVAAMGISHELDDLIRTVKFESPHTLTRGELHRFGIDTRTLAETMWTLEKGARPSISKFAMLKKENGASFRMIEWRLSCENKDRVPLRFTAEIDETAVGKSEILMAASADTKQEAGGFPLRVGKYEVWSGALGSDMVKAMLASRTLQVRETTPMPDGKPNTTTFEIEVSSLAPVWPQLAASCASTTISAKSPWPASPWPTAPGPATLSPSVSATPSATP
ncbi:hypothetical protein [Bradyrhizobium sp. RDM4]|uniref:hypothetical protein n=1 Tax=Bradyrhizobium sp. RDM4 TaxID=3378765 RepID=UPI0038FBEFF8